VVIALKYKEALIKCLCEQIAAKRGASNLYILLIYLGYCAACALRLISHSQFNQLFHDKWFGFYTVNN